MIFRNIRTTLEMIKIEHTLFALPFAFLGAVLAARGIPTAQQMIWITLAMVGARSTAMAFNRIADREFDARNPRTKMRALPAGNLSTGFVLAFTIISAGRCARIQPRARWKKSALWRANRATNRWEIWSATACARR